MHFNRFQATAIATVIAVGGTTFLGAAPAMADTDRHSEKSVSQHTYSDTEVVNFLVFGEGAVAKRLPALGKEIRDSSAAASTLSRAQLVSVVDGLTEVDPDFHSVVTLGAQKGNVYAARAAVNRLNKDIKKMNAVAATDAAGTEGFVSVQTAVSVQLVVAAVAVVALALAVAVVPVVLYQFDGAGQDNLKTDGIAAGLASGL